jgi:hypothetical protein
MHSSFSSSGLLAQYCCFVSNGTLSHMYPGSPSPAADFTYWKGIVHPKVPNSSNIEKGLPSNEFSG